jgi:hypothetical protein
LARRSARFDIAKFDNPKLRIDAVAGVGAMRAVRLFIVALTALALAILPMSAGIAKPLASKAEVSMTAPDHACPGSDASHDQDAGACSLKCCTTAAILVEAQTFVGQLRVPATDMAAAALAPFALPPDPPPPRS